jgi:hypothetical protein
MGAPKQSRGAAPAHQIKTKGTGADPTATLAHYRRGYPPPCRSLALLTATTIRLLFLLPGLMLFAALLSALALTALPTLLATLVLLALIVLIHVFSCCATEK